MSIIRLTSAPASNLVEIAKSTTTQSISRGDLVKLTSGALTMVATVTDATSTNQIWIAENRSISGASTPVRVYMDNTVEYEGTLDTATTVSVGDYLKLVSAEEQKVAKAATTTDARMGMVVKAQSAATVAKFRLLAPTLSK